MKDTSELAQAKVPKKLVSRLFKITSELTQNLDLEKVVQEFVNLAVEFTGAAGGFALIVDNDRNTIYDYLQDLKYRHLPDKAAPAERLAKCCLAIKNNEPYFEPDTSKLDNFLYTKFFDNEIRSMIATPINYEQEIIGVISVVADKPHTFKRHHKMILSLLVQAASVAIMNAVRHMQVSKLVNLYKSIGATDNFNYIVKCIADNFSAYGCSLFTRDMKDPTGKKDLFLFATTGIKEDNKEKISYEIGEGLTGYIVKTGNGLRIYNSLDQNQVAMAAPDLKRKNAKHPEFDPKVGDYPPRPHQFLGVPLIYKKEIIGVLRIVRSIPARHFTAQDQEILSLVAAHLAPIVLLSQECSFYSDIVDSTQDSVVVARTMHEVSGPSRWIIEYANASANLLLGYQRGDLLGKNAKELYGPKATEQIREKIRDSKSSQLVIETEVHDRHGRAIPIRLSWSKLSGPKNRSLGISRDITEIRDLHDELKQSVNERTASLNIALEYQKSLLDTVIHEMDAPTVAIRGIAETLQKGISSGRMPFQRQLRKLTHIDEMCQYIFMLTRTIILAESEQVIGSELTDFWLLERDILERSINFLKPMLRNKELPLDRIEIFLRGVPRYVRVNHELFQLVFFNLLSNAIKYSQPDPDLFHIQIGAKYSRREGLVLHISDWGIGIPKAEAEKIFEERMKGSNAQETPGMGLGLWVINRILQANGCKIWVEHLSNPTTFAVDIPLHLLFDERLTAEE